METWEDIYDFCKNAWKGGLPETICGSGSTIKNSLIIIKTLNKIINNYNIKSIADIGCGDFNWMRYVYLNGTRYIGYDWLIDTIANTYKSESIKFIKGNVAIIPIQKVDLIICKDVMIHMNNDHALEILNNIRKSRPGYLFITTYDIDSNMTRTAIKNFFYTNSNYMPLNIELEPFNITGALCKIKLDGNKYFNLYKLND